MSGFDRVAARRRCEAAKVRGLYDPGSVYLSPTDLRELATAMGTDLAAALDELDAKDAEIARLREIVASIAPKGSAEIRARQALTGGGE